MITHLPLLKRVLLNGLACYRIPRWRILLFSSGFLSFFHPMYQALRRNFFVVMANEDLDFVRSLSTSKIRGLFAYASRTLFKAGSLVSLVAADQDDVLSSDDLSRERDGLKEKCETFESGNIYIYMVTFLLSDLNALSNSKLVCLYSDSTLIRGGWTKGINVNQWS